MRCGWAWSRWQWRSAAHGVVDALVSVMRDGAKTKGLSGLVNAMLRKVAADLDRWDSLPPPRLPKWLRGPLTQAYNKAVIADIEAAHSRGAALDLSVKRGFAADLGGRLLPGGSLRLDDPGQVSALPGYDTGDWWVQDAAAAIPARVLAAKAGETVLDMCAAPGGKTMQLAAMGAKITALDVSASRMKRVDENLQRTGLTAKTVVADAVKWQPDQAFDAILLDAPCSATGTIRRHPDLPYGRDGSNFMELFALQAQLLDRALGWLKPGGRLIFCTCSLLPDEGEVQIEEALERHSDLSLDLKSLKVEGVQPEWINDVGLRLRPDYWPDLGGMDGFFVGALRKAA